ncbi:MAG: hypothetical protein WC604_03935 [Candidatus Gracilibacteria bacterium]
MKQKILKIGLIITLAILSSLLLTHIAGATYELPDSLKPDNVPFDIDFNATEDGADAGTSALIKILQIIAGALLYFAAPLAVIAIGMIAFNMAMGSGSTEKIEAQKKNLTWAILGLVTIILSFSIIKILITFSFGLFSAETTP